jgi:5-methylcytosine-specific restriction endonuclease McrA
MLYKKKNIPLKIKSYIAVRDNGICQICGKIGELKPTYFGYMAFEKIPAWYCHDKGAVSGIYPNLMSFEIDHIHPESAGGTLDLENLRLACRSCNRSKGCKITNKK